MSAILASEKAIYASADYNVKVNRVRLRLIHTSSSTQAITSQKMFFFETPSGDPNNREYSIVKGMKIFGAWECKIVVH